MLMIMLQVSFGRMVGIQNTSKIVSDTSWCISSWLALASPVFRVRIAAHSPIIRQLALLAWLHGVWSTIDALSSWTGGPYARIKPNQPKLVHTLSRGRPVGARMTDVKQSNLIGRLRRNG